MKSLTVFIPPTQQVILTECSICKDFDPDDPEAVRGAQYITVNALWDTGCSGVAISQRVIDTLGLVGNGVTDVHNAGETYQSQYYPIAVKLPNNTNVHFLRATLAKTHGFDILIGMQIISKGDFAVTNYEGQMCMTFRIPSIKRENFVAENEKYSKMFQIRAKKHILTCPCGSGKLYKNCHGKD